MSKKIYLTIIALVALLTVLIAAIYIVQSSKSYDVGVKAGDVFTYQMTGTAETSPDDVEGASENFLDISESFLDINNIDFYRVEITTVDFPFVSYTETTQFKNGTNYSLDGAINVKTGDITMDGGFWGVFIANLSEGSLSRPDAPKSQSGASEGITIDSIEQRVYLDGNRATNFMSITGDLYDMDDPYYTRTGVRYTYVSFDKQLGILVELKDMQIYNNPQISLTVELKLVESNVLQVP